MLGKDTQNSKETVEFFLTHHEDYEIQLHEMIVNISAELAHLSSLLPFRLLIYKMNAFSLKMKEHGELEDVLFVK